MNAIYDLASTPAPGQKMQTLPPRAPGRKRVLVADDDAMVRAALVAVLESEGYLVDAAATGPQTLVRAARCPPDLVLLDLNMPDADGWSTFARLDRQTPLLPVIVITARPNQYVQAARLGVDAFMEKPLNIPILLWAIKRLVNESPAQHLRRINDREFITRYLDNGCGDMRTQARAAEGDWPPTAKNATR